ncbi:hypothetical protein A2U01_0107019, partial [Trifolium medium]|nr:hypothetical protein [Trifolium medium]
MPQSSTGEASFTMVYGTDAMIPAEVNPPVGTARR